MRRVGFPLVMAILALTGVSKAMAANPFLLELPYASNIYSYSYATGVAGDGSLVVGYSTNANGNNEAIYSSNGVLHLLGFLPGASYEESSARAVNGNGSVIVGYSINSTNSQQAVRWDNGVITALPFINGALFNASQALGVNKTGNYVVGYSFDSTGSQQAVLWDNNNIIHSLGFLPGAPSNFSAANDVSDDGSLVVGSSTNSAFEQEAVVWNNMVISGLGFLPGAAYNSSEATAVSNNSHVIVGNAINLDSRQQAVKWINGTITGLDFLPGVPVSMQLANARATNEDGSVIVGFSSDASGQNQAVRWKNGTTPELLADILTAQNVDLTGWNLIGASGVSDNGKMVSGIGIRSGNYTGFIANLETGGVTTPGDLGQSVGSVPQVTIQAANITSLQLSQSLFQARNLIPTNILSLGSSSSSPPATASSSSLNDMTSNAGGPYKTLWQMYTTGSMGLGQNNDFDSHDLNGTVGIKAQVTPSWAFGGGVIGSTGRSDLVFEGKSKIEAIGLAGIAAYAPVDNGLRIYGSIFAADLDLSIRRGYTNGNNLDSSKGDTGGFAYGAAGQVGWNFPVNDRYSIMPYTELRWSKTQIDRYSESGGAFAASFSDQDVANSSARLGIEQNYLLKPNLNLMGRVAVAHRLNGQGSGVTADISGLTQNLGSQLGDKNWGEAAVGLGWQMNERTYLSGEVNFRSGNTPEPAVTATVGLSIKF